MRKSPRADVDQEEAARLLRAHAVPGQFPGAASTRLHGRFAALTLTGGVTLNCFHWEIEFSQEFADATAHGDFWRVRVPLTQDWQARVQGYLLRSAAATYLTAISDAASNGGIGADPAALTLTLFANDGTGGAPPATAFFQGTCWAQRGRVLVPQAMVTQEVELVSAQVPGKMI